MSKMPAQTGSLFNPFPGLRPFNQDESHLFFGREGQSKSVLNSLKQHDFVAVIGASGSGKSSLIYCGVIPELMANLEEKWIAVSTRPGSNPLNNFFDSIIDAIPGSAQKTDVEKLVSGKSDLGEWLKDILPSGARLLLVIDQFEEIFRYKESGDSANPHADLKSFVKMIHKGSVSADLPVSIVLTMRSDFIGECAMFQDLTDLINESNYLIPQMTRDDFRKAIEGPVGIGGAKIEEALVEQLLDEVGINTDQLPVLQHALMRTWDYWSLQNDPDKPISVGDYEAIGRMEKALSDHANEAYDELSEKQRDLCESIFKALTEKGGDNRGVRRPGTVKRVAQISRSLEEEVIAVAEIFRIKGRTFLTPYQPVQITEDTVLDISHESLMRIWDRLRLWVDEEASSVLMYNRLSEASALFQEGRTGLWRPPDLQLALNWREKQKPTATWAVQYNPAFERAMVYLDTSDAEFRKEEENKIRLQRRRLKLTRVFSLILGGIAVVAMGLFLWTRDLKNDAQAAEANAVDQAAIAEERRIEADEQRAAADSATAEALRAREAAIRERDRAEEETLRANAATQRAESSESLALRQEDLARRSADTALVRQLEAEAARREAEIAREEAFGRRMLSIAKSMAVKSLQINDDFDLKALLAFQAYSYNRDYEGPGHESDIYAGLYNARKAILGSGYNVFKGHTQSVNSLVFHPNSEYFYTAGSDGQILKWKFTEAGKAVSKIDSNALVIFQSLAISPDGKILAAGTNGAGIYLYNTEAPSEAAHLLKTSGGSIYDLEFAAHSGMLYSLGNDSRILKWDPQAGSSVVIAEEGPLFSDMALSPDGKLLAAVDKSQRIYLIDTEKPGGRDTILGAILSPIYSVDFSNDGKLLAAGDEKGNVRIYSTKDKSLIASLRGSISRLNAVKFSPNDTYIASGGYDHKVHLWEMANLNNPPIVMDDNGGFVFTVGFSPDESTLVSGSSEADRLIARPVTAVNLVEDICNLITRNLTEDEWENYVGADIPFQKTCVELITE